MQLLATIGGQIVFLYIPENLFDNAWVKVFRIIPEFRILRLTFPRKSTPKC